MLTLHRTASRFLLVTLPTLLLAFCEFAARSYDGWIRGDEGLLLRLGEMLEHILASGTIVCAVALLLNYLECWYAKTQSTDY